MTARNVRVGFLVLMTALVGASAVYVRAQQPQVNRPSGRPTASGGSQAPADWGVPLPQMYFRAPEDTRKTGERPDASRVREAVEELAPEGPS